MRSLVVWLLLAGCSGPASTPEPVRPPRPAPERAAHAEPPAEIPPLPPAVMDAPARLVAIGDVHGDLTALRDALRLAGAIDENDAWSGGELWVVQTGDLLDRGDDEPHILAMIDRLATEAEAAGGRLIALNGNHEVMNAQGDFRYVTEDGLHDYDRYADEAPRGRRPRVPREAMGRAVAFMPGGPVARRLAAHATAVRIGDTVLVHGGITPTHAGRGIATLNDEVRAFLLGTSPLPAAVSGEDSPIWHRTYAMEDDPEACAELAASLEALGARRMVVGHTVQERGITSGCEERVWRIDVGLARHYGGPNEVLEIRGDAVTVLR